MAIDGTGDDGVRAPVPSAPTEAMPEGFLAPGQILGDRYQIRSQLGRGGMGEVWRAFDLKLRVEVALKALLPELFKDEKRRNLLRREVRAAREVISPNVCRIFDLIEVDGRELVSMEYVDGDTLLGVLQERGPLDLKEAQDVASQFLAGLEAIHQAGLVHRDVKPENIMLTRAGRVVLMDFGLARGPDSDAGTVSGTPAYMAPEQAAGLDVDARADVYSAGVVLAEMVSPDGIKDLQSRQSVWEGIRHEPAKVPDTPWAPVLKRAVAREPDQRYNSAHTLTRALEDVTLRVEGAEDLTPYPGLASFTEADAEYFFGREAEIEQVWSRLDRPHLLALVGPSGAGKTSFLRAGLIPSADATWGILRCTPGNTPLVAVGQTLAHAMAGDADAVALLVRAQEPDVLVEIVARWRRRHDNALLIVDQFEELFTHGSIEEQREFAELMARLALEADVFVMLSMRDDFLIRCREHDSLSPAFTDLTALLPPTGAALRRAVVQPAMKSGFRFEDDELIEEMLSEVEGERGALPLLAFALARLWEMRDRENGLLTKQAYLDIGGVGGALARHAEATLEKIGVEQLPVVRELFRNLVTAEGTRAVRKWGDLLSIFSDSQSESPEEVLRRLIDARLLTSYEVRSDDDEPTRMVEIIHESLLANWPRLVRWQTQDADAVQLRDQLRQAARTWQEHERSDDMLWTGSAYREFASWRERYPGGLTDIEEAFGDAMTALAGRRRRRRRIVVAAGFAVLMAGLAIVGSFWQRSVRETRRAEASELLALGQLEIDTYPSATIAYTIASLEFANNPGARRLAQEALWNGPTAFVANEESSVLAEFTPDGRSLVQAGDGTGHLRLIRVDGTSELLEHRHEAGRIGIRMGLDNDVFFSFGFLYGRLSLPFLGLWSAAEGRMLGGAEYEGPVKFLRGVVSAGQERLVYMVTEGELGSIDVLGFDGTRERLGSLDFGFTRRDWRRRTDLEPRTGRWLGAVVDDDVLVIEIGEHGLSEPRRLGRHEGSVTSVYFDPLGRFFATADVDGQIRLWDVTGRSLPTILEGPPGGRLAPHRADESLLEASVMSTENIETWVWSLDTDPPQLLRRIDLGLYGIGAWEVDGAGRRVIRSGPDLKIRLWPMGAPADAEPVFLLRGEVGVLWGLSIHPQGHWLASADKTGVALWPMARPYPAVIRRHEKVVDDLVFGPAGRWLVSCSMDDTVRLWPLEGEVPLPGRILLEDHGKHMNDMARTPDGQHLLVGTDWSGVRLLSLSGEESQNVPDIGPGVLGATISPDGRLAAGIDGNGTPETRILVWDLASGETVTNLRPEGQRVRTAQFTGDGHLLSSSELGLRRWNLETGESELIYDGIIWDFSASEDGARVIVIEKSERESSASERAVYLDLETGEKTSLETHGTRINAVALGAEGNMVVTGDMEGVVRVGPVTGEAPHLLIGHEHAISALAVDPLGRWIASGGHDATVRLWPMPDLSKPPLHTLPHAELIAKLKTLTNLRVVRDEESDTGWKLEVGPFPGWETVPSW